MIGRDDIMKESLEDIMLMGIGALAYTGEKAKELKDGLLKKGTEAYEQGKVLNEELKHNISEKIKENVTIVKADLSKDEIADQIKNLSAEDKKEILSLLKDKKENNTKDVK